MKSARRHERDSYSVTWQVYRARLVDVTEMLVPAVALHGALWTLILVSGLVLTEVVGASGLGLGALLSEWLFHDLLVLHLAVHPVLLLWCSEALRREARAACGLAKLCVPISVAAPAEADSQFDILGSVWAREEVKEDEVPLQVSASRFTCTHERW